MPAAAALLVCTIAAPAHGQAIPGVLQETERVQREQEQRRLDQLQRDRESARPPAVIEAPVPVLPSGTAATARCRSIRVVDVEGVRRLPLRQQRALTRGYEGRCLAASDIERLLGDITKAYIERGYAATRAYLPAQDLTTGTLRIVVIEGRVSGIEVRGKPGSVNTANAFPGVVGKPLNLRDLEQGVDQINRLASNRATLDLQPGAEPGDTQAVVTNVPTRRLRGTFNADNLGSRSTGQVQAGLTASLEGVLGLNELLSVTRRQSAPFNDEDRARSSSETYFVSVPLGYATFSAGVTDSRYRTLLRTASGTDLELRGTSNNVFASLDYVLMRNRTDQVVATAAMTRKDNKNYVAGQLLDVGSRRLTVLDLDLRGQTSRFGGFVTAGIGLSQGIGLFHALEEPANLPEAAPVARFTKIRASLSYFNGFAIGRQRVELSSALAAQYAFDTLYGSEQFAVGGVYSVRGFRETTLANDNGWYMRNEIGAPLALGGLWGAPLVIRPYVGLDVGRVEGHTRDTLQGTLAGGALGGSINFGRTYFDIFASRRIAAPRALRNEGVQLFARASVRI